MAVMYTSLKLISSKPRDYTKFSYDLIIKYKNGLYIKPTPFHEKTLVSNGTFNQSGSTGITPLPTGKHEMSLKFIIKYNNEVIIKEVGKKSKLKQYGITTHTLKTTHGITTTNPRHTVPVTANREKNKFIIICGGRGMGRHNQGANFLNCAKYHIEDIKQNKFPGLPKFDSATCEIVTPQDVYRMGGYTVFTEQNRGQPDGYYQKPVPKGEIHRVTEFKKIFDHYKKIKYIAYFGHSWANPIDNGYLLIGDRAVENTNLYANNISSINKNNVLQSAQLRFFGCRSSCTKDEDGAHMKPIAELFARHFRGRKCYGWASVGGSIVTDEPYYGRTGKNPKVNPNSRSTSEVNSNIEKTWLTANGYPNPPGWKYFKY